MSRAGTKKCKSCGECKRLYQKFGYRYWKAKSYYCALREEVTETGNGCERWRTKKCEYDLSKQRFDEVEEDIKLLAEYLEEA